MTYNIFIIKSISYCYQSFAVSRQLFDSVPIKMIYLLR